MTGSRDDAELIARTAVGDAVAFEELMARHEDMIFAVCLRILGDRHEALDATQEVFLTLFRKASQYRGSAAVTTWLYRVAVNACYDILRKQRRRPLVPLPESHDPEDVQAPDAFEAVELRPSLEAALSRLPIDFRTVVVMADVQGLALPDVAGLLDIPVGTVKSRLFRARRLLAGMLGNQKPSSGHPMDERHA